MKRFFQAVLLVLFAVLCRRRRKKATTPGLVNNNTATTKQAAVAHLRWHRSGHGYGSGRTDYNLYKGHEHTAPSGLAAGRRRCAWRNRYVASADDGDNYNGSGERNDDAAATLPVQRRKLVWPASRS